MRWGLYRSLLILFCVPLVIGIITNLMTMRHFSLSILLIVLWGSWLYFRPWLREQCQQISAKQLRIIISVVFVVIFGAQLFSLIQLPISVYHDPYRVLNQAQLLSQGNDNWGIITYFWRYPNNVPVAWLLACWLKCTSLLGLSVNVAVNLLNLLILDSFIYVSVRLVQRFAKSNLNVLEYLFFLATSSFCYTYFLKVFYTDMPLLLAMIVNLYVLLSWRDWSKEKRVGALVVLIVLNVIAELIKSNFIIFVVALLMVVLLFGKKIRQEAKKLWKPLLTIVISIIVAIPLMFAVEPQVNFHHSDRYQVPLLHWINMGYNPQTNGIYSGDDLKAVVKQKGRQNKEKYLKQTFNQRLHKLGALGIIRQWYKKTCSLFNINGFINSYNGGYQKIPKGYGKIQAPLHYLGVFFNQLAYIVLLSELLIVTLKDFWRRKYEPSFLHLLTLITAGGFIAFFVFVWEVNSRYGQILLPLFIAYLATSPYKKELAVSHVTKNWLLIPALLLTLIMNYGVDKNVKKEEMTVSVQTSQLSRQYGFKTPKFSGTTDFAQKMTFNHEVTNFTMITPRRSNFTATLINQTTKKSYPLTMIDSQYSYKDKLPAGDYKLQLKAINPHKKMRVVITDGLDYQISAHSLVKNGQQTHNHSLVYVASYYR